MEGSAGVDSNQRAVEMEVDLLGVSGSRIGNSSGLVPSSSAINGSPSGGGVVDDLLGGGFSASNGGGGRRVSNGSSSADAAMSGSLRGGLGSSSPSSSVSAGALAPGLDLSGLYLGGGGGPPSAAGGIGGGSGFSFGGQNMTPLAITTGEFGKRWMTCTGERRTGGSAHGLVTPNAAVDKLVSRLRVHKVEIIPHTSEGICAGQLEGGGSVCLVHCKVGRELLVSVKKTLQTISAFGSCVVSEMRCWCVSPGRFPCFHEGMMSVPRYMGSFCLVTYSMAWQTIPPPHTHTQAPV